MPTISEQINKINETVGKINTTTGGNKLTPLKPITPQSVQGDVPTIDIQGAEQLTQPREVDLGIPTRPKPDQFVQDLERQAQQSQKAEAAGFDEYVNQVLNAPTEAEIRADVEKKTGLAEKQLVVDQYQTQLITEQDKLRTLTERVLSEGGGLKSGAASEIANAERESYAKQADIALLQLAAQDQLDYATTVTDRAVDAMFSRQEKINEVMGMVYQRNKELFDKDEQRLFETKQADRERQLQWEKDQEKLLQGTKIDILKMAQLNQAPQSVIEAIGNARTPEEVLNAGGQWGVVDLLQRQELRNSMANQALARRADLLALAKEGDRGAIAELGYDPNNMPLSPQELEMNEEAYRQNAQDQLRVSEMMSNSRGINALTGAITSPALGGFFAGGEAGQAGDFSISGLGRFVPVVGNIMGSAQSIRAARSLETDLNYITNNLTLDRFLELKQQGATFGALSEGEWRIIGGAASELSNMIIRDESGRIEQINATPAEIQEQLRIIDQQYKIAERKLNASFLSTSDSLEIENNY